MKLGATLLVSVCAVLGSGASAHPDNGNPAYGNVEVLRICLDVVGYMETVAELDYLIGRDGVEAVGVMKADLDAKAWPDFKLHGMTSGPNAQILWGSVAKVFSDAKACVDNVGCPEGQRDRAMNTVLKLEEACGMDYRGLS